MHKIVSERTARKNEIRLKDAMTIPSTNERIEASKITKRNRETPSQTSNFSKHMTCSESTKGQDEIRLIQAKITSSTHTRISVTITKSSNI